MGLFLFFDIVTNTMNILKLLLLLYLDHDTIVDYR